MGNFIYIVYKGEVNLTKKFSKTLEKQRYKDKLSQFSRLVKKEVVKIEETILKMSRGAIAGLEILTEAAKYEYSLIVRG